MGASVICELCQKIITPILGSLLNLFSSDITDQELEQFLLDIIQRQSPGVQRLVARLRTPDGRQVFPYCSVHCKLLYSVYCTLYTVQCSHLKTMHCTFYFAHWTAAAEKLEPNVHTEK